MGEVLLRKSNWFFVCLGLFVISWDSLTQYWVLHLDCRQLVWDLMRPKPIVVAHLRNVTGDQLLC